MSVRGSFTGLREVRVEFGKEISAMDALMFELITKGSARFDDYFPDIAPEDCAPALDKVLADIHDNTLAHEAQERDRLQGEFLND